MKKLVALLLAAMMLCVCIPAMAEEAPEGYPEVVPGVDFGGAKVTIYNYWGPDTRPENPDAEQEAIWAYRDWLMKTYNCEIEVAQDGDWGSVATQLVNFVSAPDGSYRLYILPPDFVGGPMTNNAVADWNKTDLIDLTDGDVWNLGTINFMTSGDKVLGISKGNNEPRACLYFNKRILEEAGIDWSTLYTMVEDGTWTWEAWEDMLAKIQKDTNNDGVIDIWGMTGSNVDLYTCAVYNNGGHFFQFDDEGKLTIVADSAETLEALNWSKKVWETYGYQQPADGAWDYYKDAWKQDFCGFYVYQCYGGYNLDAEMNDGPDWGCVPIPKGKGDYVTTVSENITVIPNVYSEEDVAKLAFIYDMWTRPTPGYDDEEDWKVNLYRNEKISDDECIDITYALIREAEHQVMHDCLYVGSLNDVLGSDFFWSYAEGTPAELVEKCRGKWQGLCDAYNAANAQ